MDNGSQQKYSGPIYPPVTNGFVILFFIIRILRNAIYIIQLKLTNFGHRVEGRKGLVVLRSCSLAVWSLRSDLQSVAVLGLAICQVADRTTARLQDNYMPCAPDHPSFFGMSGFRHFVPQPVPCAFCPTPFTFFLLIRKNLTDLEFESNIVILIHD